MFYNVRRTENKDVLMLHRKGEAGRGGEVVVMGRRWGGGRGGVWTRSRREKQGQEGPEEMQGPQKVRLRTELLKELLLWFRDNKPN